MLSGRSICAISYLRLGPPDALPTADPRLENNPFFHDHFQGVEKELTAKGLEKSSTADLLIHYHANVVKRFSVSGVGRVYGPCSNGDCQPHYTDYEAGTLVLDIVDARTNKLVWRGWAQRRVGGVVDDQILMRKYVIDGAERMMAQFPPLPK